MISQKMIRALGDAQMALHRGGLIYTRAGWRRPDDVAAECHHVTTVQALVSRGYLRTYGGSKGVARRASIEARGEEALREELDAATRSARAAR